MPWYKILTQFSRLVFWTIVVVSVSVFVELKATAFSGEKPLCTNEFPTCTWYHEIITEESARGLGYEDDDIAGNRGAAEDLAWESDYIDSYLYNPIWWLGGLIDELNLDRLRVSLASRDELAKLHFDDLFSNETIRAAWKRYTTGTIAGLMWASEKNDVSAARNIIGVSLHAIQDFYSHSNWVDDPLRREQTWFEYPFSKRSSLPLYTGSFERDDLGGIKPHGEVVPSCTILRRDRLSSLLDTSCAGISPLSNSSMCLQWRSCQDGVSIRPPILSGRIPDDVIYLSPPGIALDSEWMSEISINQRTDNNLSGIDAFNKAKELATRNSEQWLGKLEQVMNHLGQEQSTFYRNVRTKVESGDREINYEDYSRFPYQFLSAGEYGDKKILDNDEFFLRVTLDTSSDDESGTSSDIILKTDINDNIYLLDYAPYENPLLRYDDFESGSSSTYTVGPFSKMPTEVYITNSSASTADIVSDFGNRILSSLETARIKVRRFFLSLIGGNANIVSQENLIFDPEYLRDVSQTQSGFSIDVDGGDEGVYRVEGYIKKTGSSIDSRTRLPNSSYTIGLTRLVCIQESTWDRGSNSDEPFLLAFAIPHGGNGDISSRLFPPFEDVDEGETRELGHIFTDLTVPDEYGFISIPIAIYESDSERASDRREIFENYLSNLEGETKPVNSRLIDTIATAIKPDWKLHSIDIYGFSRGNNIYSGTLLKINDYDKWINANDTVMFRLNTNNLAFLGDFSNGLQRMDMAYAPWNLTTTPTPSPTPFRLPSPLIFPTQ